MFNMPFKILLEILSMFALNYPGQIIDLQVN